MFEWKDKVYRSLEEQVQKNMDDIEELKEGGIRPSPTDWKPAMTIVLGSLESISNAIGKVAWSIDDGSEYKAPIDAANQALARAIEELRKIYKLGNTIYIETDANVQASATDEVLYIRSGGVANE